MHQPQGCARDLLSRDQDKMLKIRDRTKMRRCSFRDAGQDLEAPETREARRDNSALTMVQVN